MEKRTIIAVVLSIVVLLSFQFLFSSKAPKSPTQGPAGIESTKGAAEEPPAPASVPAVETPPAPVKAPAKERLITVDTELYTATLSSTGGTVTSWRLKKYKDKAGLGVSLLEPGGLYRALAVGSGGDYSLSEKDFSVSGGDIDLKGEGNTASLVFGYSEGGVSLRRTYTFHSDTYHLDLVDEAAGLPGYEITLGADFGIHNKKGDSMSHTGPVLLEDMDRVEVKPDKLKEARTYTGKVKWVALEEKYFFASIVPGSPMSGARVWKYQDSAPVALAGSTGENRFMVYVGPKAHDELKRYGVGLEHIVDFGFFSVIARPIFWLMKQFYRLVGNYGWAIVLLTIAIRVPFIPIVQKGQKSMKRLQDLQPRMQEVKEKYKKDPQRMQQEMMALYKKHKVNPMGGCLPMLLQIPVFFALYKVLLVAIELRGAPFALWITDLSQKDPYYIFPIVMGASMVLQQKMTPTAGDPKQQKMMMFMPVIFTFLFLNFPSGLVLYWLVNNVLSISQQLYTNLKKS